MFCLSHMFNVLYHLCLLELSQLGPREITQNCPVNAWRTLPDFFAPSTQRTAYSPDLMARALCWLPTIMASMTINFLVEWNTCIATRTHSSHNRTLIFCAAKGRGYG
jgi:hypothetical protein